jgi:hypothetical protein
MVALSSNAASPARASALINARITAFRGYIAAQQSKAELNEHKRVVVQVLRGGDPETAVVLSGKKKTLPIVVFLAVMIAVTGLAFMLENMRPRVRPVERSEAVATRLSA